MIAQLATGTKVEVLGVSGGFTKVSYNGTVGYINSNYLKLLSAIIVAIFLSVPYWKGKYFHKKKIRTGEGK